MESGVEKRTERLDIVLVETALDILDHQTCFSYLRVTDHPDLDNHTVGREGGRGSGQLKRIQKHNRALIALITVLCALGLGLLRRRRVGGRHEKCQWVKNLGGVRYIYYRARARWGKPEMIKQGCDCSTVDDDEQHQQT